jgi:1-acyl-sn-glycerol-3-phosphate acyltransferase
MADPSTVADRARSNGGGAGELNGHGTLRDRLSPLGGLRSAGGPLGRVGRGLLSAASDVASEAASGAARRVRHRLRADLDDRDPDWLRERLPLMWLLATIWFRGEVRNLGNIPEKGPVLLVGNHSGGNVTPDTFIFTLAFSSYFGIERKFHQLAHNLVVTLPVSGALVRRGGTVAASHKNAQKALEAGAALLVYPGGDWEVHRPSWESDRVDFAGRKGFIRLAVDQDVPIVPVVSIGGQETALFLSRGDRLAEALRLDRMFRLKVLPISLAVPWGVNVGDFLGHVPLPAKITTEVLPAIDLREQFGPEPDIDEVYEHITNVMQETLEALAAERRYPVIG